VEFLSTAVLIAATAATGLAAGLLFGFACAVMPGLARASDRTFVEAMQRINVAILNPWFLAVFIGAPVLAAGAVALHLPADRRPVVPWVAAAIVLYLAGLVLTGRINVPLNEQLMAVGSPDSGALRAARGRFEARWVRWNLVRTVTFIAAFGCLAGALVVRGGL
jgi:uncharacterized membrane protein